MTLFTDKAPSIMRDLMRDFGLDIESAAAILGNLGHESGGFKFLQEMRPIVPGSRGGYGWAQWTGPRRVAFEAYCKRNGLDPASDKANYGYLFVELTGSEKLAIPAVKAAKGLYNKVVAFEAKFERAGVKHYPSRLNYAQQALKAFGSPVTPPPAPSDLILRFGDGISVNQTVAYANAIKDAQKLLKATGYYAGIIDGMFGKKTEAAVKLFQKDRRLAQDGVVGPLTWAALRTPNPDLAIMGEDHQWDDPDAGMSGRLQAPYIPQPPAKETTPMEALSGKKTYIAVAVGGVIVLANAIGIELPGVDLDKAAWLEQFWSLGIIATFRSAIAKLLA